MLSNKNREQVLHGIKVVQDRIRIDTFNRCMPASLIEKFFSLADRDELILKREYLIEQGHIFVSMLQDVSHRIRSNYEIGDKDLEVLQKDLDESPVKREFIETAKSIDQIFLKIPPEKLKKEFTM